jgi:hypothetical protein
MNSYRHLAQLVVACAIAALATACGSNSTSSGPTPSATTPSASATSGSPSPSGAAATITTNWETFFNAATPVSKRVMLLQDGSMFPASVLAATGLAAQAKAQVLGVSGVTATQATVRYTILLAGTAVPGLKNKAGIAVYQNGVWKVGAGSFCGLLKLENGGKTSGLPAPCTSAT